MSRKNSFHHEAHEDYEAFSETVARDDSSFMDTGEPALQLIEQHGYIPHVKGRGQEAIELANDPNKRARRWVVGVAHSWFNRFRKLLVRYEKLERSFIALNHLAAAIIAFRKVPLEANIIYGQVLSPPAESRGIISFI